MEKLETIAKKLAEISANYTYGGKTLSQVISEFNSNSELNITEEEYKEAKKIVADYEFWNHPLIVESRKQFELNQFCDELKWSNSGLMDGMSVRLCNALKHLHIKVCDLTKKQFLSVKGNGLKSWIEFCEKTGKTI